MRLSNKTNKPGGRNTGKKEETNEETYEVWEWTICLSISLENDDEKGVNVGTQKPRVALLRIHSVQFSFSKQR